MFKKINLDPLNIILDKLEFNKKNVYLGVDFILLVKELKPQNINYTDVAEFILNYFIKKIGKSGNLIIPVFNFDCVLEKKFDVINSPGQSGVLGNILLKSHSNLRTSHPMYSFLCFGNNFKKYKKVNCLNGTAKNSLWRYFIEDNFELITLGHHYSRSLTHTHYIEDLLNVDYRFNKKFTIIYKDQNNKSSKKTYSFFARKKEVCDFSGMTKTCDKLFIKENIAKFYRYKNFISFKLDIKEASNLFYMDLKSNSEKLISYIRTNKINKNILCGYDGSITQLEKSYTNFK